MLLKLDDDNLCKVEPESLALLELAEEQPIPDIEKWEDTFRALFPTGWAFRYPKDGFKASVIRILAEQFAKAEIELAKVKTTLSPLNEDFDIVDVELKEKQLAIIPVKSKSIEVRKAVILRKQRNPGTQLPRAGHLWIQKLIQESGFPNVFVHENRTGSSAPYTAIDLTPYITEGGKICANYLEQDVDDANISGLDDPDNFHAQFLIGGSAFGEFINMPESQYESFRQMLISIKPQQTVGILLFNLLPY